MERVRGGKGYPLRPAPPSPGLHALKLLPRTLFSAWDSPCPFEVGRGRGVPGNMSTGRADVGVYVCLYSFMCLEGCMYAYLYVCTFVFMYIMINTCFYTQKRKKYIYTDTHTHT